MDPKPYAKYQNRSSSCSQDIVLTRFFLGEEGCWGKVGVCNLLDKESKSDKKSSFFSGGGGGGGGGRSGDEVG